MGSKFPKFLGNYVTKNTRYEVSVLFTIYRLHSEVNFHSFPSPFFAPLIGEPLSLFFAPLIGSQDELRCGAEMNLTVFGTWGILYCEYSAAYAPFPPSHIAVENIHKTTYQSSMGVNIRCCETRNHERKEY